MDHPHDDNNHKDDGTVLEMIQCPTCHKMVPRSNLELHQRLHADHARIPSRPSPDPLSSSSAAQKSDTTTENDPSAVNTTGGNFTTTTTTSTTTSTTTHSETVPTTPDHHRHHRAHNMLQQGTTAQTAISIPDSSTSPQQEWSCPRCTLRNSIQATHCQVCEAERPNTQQRNPDPQQRVLVFSPPSIRHNSTTTTTTAAAATLGGLVAGVASAYMTGRPLASGALNGAMTGAVVAAATTAMRNTSPHDTTTRRTPTLASSSSPQVVIPIHRYPTRSTYRYSTVNLSPQYHHPILQQFLADHHHHQQQHLLQQQFHPDIDGMSYEQLLQRFGDGTEHLAAQEHQIDSLPVSIVHNPEQSLPQDCRDCAICLEPFEDGQERKILPCLHGFHNPCITQWLRNNGACPICKFRI